MLRSWEKGIAGLALCAAVGCGLSWVPAAKAADGAATAATATVPNDKTKASKEDSLEEIVVTGSLIPQSQKENFTPVTVITAEDIQAKGFSDVAEALQRASFATGSVQNGQYSGGFTEGAKVISMFGLNESYTKYLINGLPFADYPALYNGTDSFVSISGIPTVLVDHIDILPGGQSSIYGSDAIAGVVNIVMKQQMDGPLIDARYGAYQQGGGADRRLAIGDGFTVGSLNVVAGAQYESQSPIWGYQRALTAQYYTQGTSPQAAYPNEEVFGYNANASYFEDPANCANVAGLFGGTNGLHSQAAIGQYCGSVKTGFNTIENGDEQVQFYLHSTYDLNDNLQLYMDTLLNHDVVRYSAGAGEYDSYFDSSSPFAYYEDPRITAAVESGDYLNLQHVFSPEEVGSLNNTIDKNTNNSVRGTLGIKGSFGSSWRWLTDMTYTDNKLTELYLVQFTQPIEAYFGKIYGRQLGYDNNLGAYIYEPNYANFYKPVTPAQFAAFSGLAPSYSYTEESMARAQVTNTDLFELPGGKAGMALQIEGGDQGWNYAPDPGYFNNQIFGVTSAAGSGHRSRYAGTAEFQMPILETLKADVSGRFDDYRLQGQNVDKATYNLGLEYRPVKQLLLRARYGTAFKAPTLADEFQGVSGYYQQLTDYYTCYNEGFAGSNIGKCPQFNNYLFATTSGNTKLSPITAKDWDLGFVVSPVSNLGITLDYIHFAIHDEVASADANKLLETDSACELGQLDPTSPSCVAALADVVRDSSGAIVSLYTPKENVSEEDLGVFQAGLNYKFDVGAVGSFAIDGSFTDMVSHAERIYVGDPLINLLNDPFYSTEFKTKGNLSVTWSKNALSVTAYVERYGRSPNYISQLVPEGYSQPGAATVSPWTLADFSADYKIIDGLDVTLALNNAFDRMPPADHSVPGNQTGPYNQNNYNVYGREYYLTVTYKLPK
jgi:outer membrane receptor protein involved in Fe transport